MITARSFQQRRTGHLTIEIFYCVLNKKTVVVQVSCTKNSIKSTCSNFENMI